MGGLLYMLYVCTRAGASWGVVYACSINNLVVKLLTCTLHNSLWTQLYNTTSSGHNWINLRDLSATKLDPLMKSVKWLLYTASVLKKSWNTNLIYSPSPLHFSTTSLPFFTPLFYSLLPYTLFSPSSTSFTSHSFPTLKANRYYSHDINVTGVWSENITGMGVVVAVVDSGKGRMTRNVATNVRCV